MVENERKDDNTGDSGGPLRQSRSEASKSPKKLRVLLRTFGCQMNVRDSEVVCGLLSRAGFVLVDAPEEAEVVLFNTCSVRQHAEDKVWSEVGRLAKLRKKEKKMGTEKRGTVPEERGLSPFSPVIGVIGCMAQSYGEKIFQRAPDVDFVAGPSDIHKIPGIILRLTEKWGQSLFSRKIWEIEGNSRPDEIYHTGFRQDKEHSYVVISEGCSNFCAYCVVPFARGALRHRDYQAVLREIEEAVENGITKITLLGQNVNGYQSPVTSHQSPVTSLKANVGFVELLKMVNEIKGLKEFGFVTSHPKDTSVELFEVMRDLEKLRKYLHLPIQSGSDRILKLMNRGYTGKFYMDLAREYRKIVKGGVLTSDIIVGFPGESEADFLDTYNLIKEIEFDGAYIFKYSPRPHTASQNLTDDVPRLEKERRHALILELQKKISKNKKNAKN